MWRIIFITAIGLIFSCTTAAPPPPGYQTEAGQKCGRVCQTQYTACMENEIRPDYLLMSPRKRACEKMLRECYGNCLADEKS